MTLPTTPDAVPGELPTPGCLIWGAGGGIGQAVARRLHPSGAALFLTARTPTRLQPLAEELGAPWGCANACNSQEVDALTERATAALGGALTGMAFCVGSILLKPAIATTDAEWEQTLALNLTAAFYATRAALRVMSPRGGSIVLVSSAAARIGLASHEAIAAAKAGLEGLVRAAAASNARRNIRVNAVAPGLVETPLSAAITGRETSLSYSRSLHALGRIGQPGDVASAIAWLLDPAQSWVTGQVLGVDGGLAAVLAR